MIKGSALRIVIIKFYTFTIEKILTGLVYTYGFFHAGSILDSGATFHKSYLKDTGSLASIKFLASYYLTFIADTPIVTPPTYFITIQEAIFSNKIVAITDNTVLTAEH